jgi:hypothetical protein
MCAFLLPAPSLGAFHSVTNPWNDQARRSDGRADKVEGKVQNALGGVKDAVRDVLKK